MEQPSESPASAARAEKPVLLAEDNTAEDNTAEDNTAEDNTAEDNTAEDNTAEDNAAGATALAREISKWMDGRFIDPILGFLLPGVGDVLSSGVGLVTVYAAIQERIPKVVIARMLLNLALDSILGSIPLLGNVIDFFYRAHRRNLELLEERRVSKKSTPGDWIILIGAAFAFLLSIVVPLYAGYLAVQWIVRTLF